MSKASTSRHCPPKYIVRWPRFILLCSKSSPDSLDAICSWHAWRIVSPRDGRSNAKVALVSGGNFDNFSCTSNCMDNFHISLFSTVCALPNKNVQFPTTMRQKSRRNWHPPRERGGYKRGREEDIGIQSTNRSPQLRDYPWHSTRQDARQLWVNPEIISYTAHLTSL